MPGMVLNIECPGCSEIFEDADDVYGTSCGHLFHFACLNDWLRRCTSCPKCYKYCPSTFKIYPNLDESKGNSHSLAGDEEKLESEKISGLLVELRAHSLQLQKHFTKIENSKREFREKIKESEEGEENLLHLQSQFMDSAAQIKELQDRIKQLVIKNKDKSKELLLKRLENETLKATLPADQTISNVLLNEKLKYLEQKLQYISEEYRNEITKSTQLSIENMKLRTYLNILSSMEENDNEEEDETKLDLMLNLGCLKKAAVTQEKNDQNENLENDVNTYNVVFIKQLPLTEVTKPLENFVLNLAAKMKVPLSLHDLIKVNLLKNKSKSAKAQLIVQFKSSKAKDEFISHKNVLKTHFPLNLCPAIDDLHELFTYAKNKLLISGFSQVFCKNYKIYAQQIDNRAELVHIQSKSQVDDLCNMYRNVGRIVPLFETLNLLKQHCNN